MKGLESRINGWRRNRRSAQSLLPAVRAVDGGFQRRRLWRLLKKISERLASWFPQTQMSQGVWRCLEAVSEGNRGNHLVNEKRLLGRPKNAPL